MYPKKFQCNNGSEFKGEVTKMLEKQEVKIRRVTTLNEMHKFDEIRRNNDEIRRNNDEIQAYLHCICRSSE